MAEMSNLEMAAKLTIQTLRNRQAEFLAGANQATPSLAAILRTLAEQDGDMADLMESAHRHDQGAK
jgi:hypothetical protein